MAVLRSEVRGWAEVAVTAKNQADSAREMINLIYHEVIEIKGILRSDVGGLKADVGGLRADVGQLKTDVGGLKADVAAHTQTLDQHTALLNEILERLPPRSA